MSDTTTRSAAETSSRQGGDHPSGDNRFELVDKHLKRGHYAQDQLIETLHVAQDVFGYLSEDILVYVARALRLPPSLVYGVATFYELFTFDPPGDHSCTVCTGTACFVKGADAIVQGVSDRYGVPAGQTAEDGSLTLKTARCLGSCGLAPVVVFDGDVMSHQTVDTTLALVAGAIGGDS
jgi:bidirectional [NiFe] hydrogenase diaphorase subunit